MNNPLNKKYTFSQNINKILYLNCYKIKFNNLILMKMKLIC